MEDVIEEIIDKVRFSHVIILILVVGYVFQEGFRKSVNNVFKGVLAFSAEIIRAITQKDNPETLLTIFTALVIVLIALLVFVLLAMLFKELWRYIDRE